MPDEIKRLGDGKEWRRRQVAGIEHIESLQDEAIEVRKVGSV